MVAPSKLKVLKPLVWQLSHCPAAPFAGDVPDGICVPGTNIFPAPPFLWQEAQLLVAANTPAAETSWPFVAPKKVVVL
jgi:hypothetical protein